MSDHIPDATKMISDTPRTDEQINGKPCTRFEILAGDCLRNAAVPSEFARTIERELNAANERIKRLEEAGDAILNAWLMPENAMEYRDWVALSADAEAMWYKAKEVKP
mgnify:CR=1 FL=1